MTDTKVSAYHKDIVAKILRSDDHGESVHYATAVLLVAEGLLEGASIGDADEDFYRLKRDDLTPHGVHVAGERRNVLDARKVKRNAYSRARADAMTSLGMKRTRNGGWE